MTERVERRVARALLRLVQERRSRRSPLEVHCALARRTPLTSGTFAGWIALCRATVDDLSAGATADHAKRSASTIAVALQPNITADQGVELTVT